jgi:2-methylisocitrate lyase-like PEP mutase family enzyme
LEAGANSIFVFGAVNDKDSIARLTREIKAPLNLLANSQLPSVEELQKLGVARVSLGSGPMRASLGLLEEISQELLKFGTYQSLTKKAVPYSELQELFD